MIDRIEIKKKIVTKINLYCLLVISIIFFLDRYTKKKIIDLFSENSYFVNNFMNLELIMNTGIGFGLFASDSILIYNLISTLIISVICILIYLALISDKFDKVIFSVIIGGALGNCYDRITLKAVPDFIDLHYLNFHWFTFNVADIFITLGIILFLLKGYFFEKKLNEKS